MSTTTLVCPCGMTLKAPGAKPGRVGKCPKCGGMLRVPDDFAPTTTKPPAPRPEVEDEPAAGYMVGAKAATSGTTLYAPPPSRSRPTSTATSAGEGPIVPPRDGDVALGKSLSYPLWSWSSIAILIYLPPALTVTSAPLPFLAGTLVGGTAFTIASLIALGPGLLMGICVWGYTLVYLGNVLISSALGETLPPRTPHFGEEDILRVLGRWFWGCIIGVGVGAVPAVVWWIYCGEIDWADRLMFVNLAALGMAYAQMALLAVLLYDDPFAANPITVVRAIRLVGWDYAGVCFLSGAFLVSVAFQLSVIAQIEGTLAHILFFWLFWVNFLYGAMVVLRRLGRFCHRHRVVLAWFPEREGWGR
jgi:hypothetical protein